MLDLTARAGARRILGDVEAVGAGGGWDVWSVNDTNDAWSSTATNITFRKTRCAAATAIDAPMTSVSVPAIGENFKYTAATAAARAMSRAICVVPLPAVASIASI